MTAVADLHDITAVLEVGVGFGGLTFVAGNAHHLFPVRVGPPRDGGKMKVILPEHLPAVRFLCVWIVAAYTCKTPHEKRDVRVPVRKLRLGEGVHFQIMPSIQRVVTEVAAVLYITLKNVIEGIAHFGLLGVALVDMSIRF